MFGFLSKKRLDNPKSASGKSVAPENISLPTVPEISVRQEPHRDLDINGQEIKEFCSHWGFSMEEAWQQIRDGKLFSRTENGCIYVYKNIASSASLVPSLFAEAQAAGTGNQINSSELAQEGWLVAKHSWDQSQKIMDALVEAKDQVIELQKKQLELQQKEILNAMSEKELKNNELRDLRQQIEDLQMLVKALN